MAKRLDKQDIVSLNIVRPYHVSQSVDAFTGIVAYDINVSGSFQVTGSTILSGSAIVRGSTVVSGSTILSGSTYLRTLTDTAQTNLLTINPTTGQLFYTASSAIGATTDTGSFFKQDGNSFGTTATLGTNDNQSLQFETNGTTKMFISSSGNVGIGTITPTSKFYVYGGEDKNYLLYDTSSVDGGAVVVSGTKNIVQMGVSTPTGSTAAQLLMGVRSSNTTNESTYSRYGKKDDTFISSTALSNGLNILNFALDVNNIKENYIRFYAGHPTNSALNNQPHLHIHGDGSNRGYIGVGTIDPQANLHISGSLLNGRLVTATGSFSHAEGLNTKTIGNNSHAEGESTITRGVSSHAEGGATLTLGNFSHAEGYQTTASGDQSHAEGQSTFASGSASHTEGYKTIASGSYSHAEGESTTAQGISSHAEGSGSRTEGNASHAEGLYTTTIGKNSHAEGEGTIARGESSHAEGGATLTLGNFSHAEGYNTTASGDQSHAEGHSTFASGSASHTEGLATIALGLYSHAEGQSTVAYGTSSHAEGGGSVSSGKFAHAEGFQTTASGEASHAEGWQTAASGEGSHASGYQTTAVGYYSYAGGANTIASGSHQTVVGTFNTHGDTTSKFIVGGGGVGSRADAFKVTDRNTIVVATQSAEPAYAGVEGEMVPVSDGFGKYYLFVFIGGGWRKTELSPHP